MKKSLNSWKITNKNQISNNSPAKRLLDIIFALTGIFFSLPLWIMISIAIYFEDGLPIFFSQERLGKDFTVFKVIKFRSMLKDAETKTKGLHEKEIADFFFTKIGKLLRNTALDELPQLINIFKGEMSFVGPRAMLDSFYQHLNKTDQTMRLAVKPGLTGLAQIYGREDISYKAKVRFDLLYIKKKNFTLDVKLILISIGISFLARWKYGKAKF